MTDTISKPYLLRALKTNDQRDYDTAGDMRRLEMVIETRDMEIDKLKQRIKSLRAELKETKCNSNS